MLAVGGALALSFGASAALAHGSKPAPTPTVDLTNPGDASQSQIAVDKWGNAIAAWTLDENPGAQNAGDLARAGLLPSRRRQLRPAGDALRGRRGRR